MTVSHVGILPGTVAGSGTLDIRIETVDGTTGLPSGTLWATNTNVAGGSLTTSTWSLQALTASATINRGDFYCVKLAYNSGTSVIINKFSNLGRFPTCGLPYRVANTGTPTKGAINNTMPMVLGSSSTAFYRVEGMLPVTGAVSNVSGGSGTMSALGMRFRIPFAARCRGLIYYPSDSTLAAITYGLYSDGWSELSSSLTSFDSDNIHIATGVTLYLPFDSSVTLSPNTWYRAAILPGAVTAIRIPTVAMPSADYSEAFPFNGDCHAFTRNTGGTIDDSTYALNFPLMDLMLDQISDDAGSGGGGSTGVIGS
jgi:hypothetical protein